MYRKCFMIALLAGVLPCGAQDVVDLGLNAETGLKEIRVNLPGLQENLKLLEMVQIPSGTFVMGSPEDELGRLTGTGYAEWLPHDVTLTESFYIGKHEVTQAQWEAVMGSNAATNMGTPYGIGDDYPVYYVSWDDCQSFVEELNALGLGTFRLPTEAEWEYACRAETSTMFWFGASDECASAGTSGCETMAQSMWWFGNRLHAGVADGAQPVGQKAPNLWGLYDTHGNMSEWCSGSWEAPYDRGAQVDPNVLVAEYVYDRITRGGYWYDASRYCRSAARAKRLYNYRHYGVGLRLVREVEDDTAVENFKQH